MFLDPFVDYLEESQHLRKWITLRQSIEIDNFIFFLHYRVSVGLFLGASLLVTAGLYVADPMDCFGDEWLEDVIDTFCFVHSTFTALPPNDDDGGHNASQRTGLVAHPGVMQTENNVDVKYHGYYQWICYILAFQAILFAIPHLLWKWLEGGQTTRLVSLARNHVQHNLQQTSTTNSKFVHIFLKEVGQRDGYYLKLVSCELLNLLLTIVQIYLATVTDFSYRDAFYFAAFSAPLERDDFLAQIFPKVTKCTFNTFGASGNIQNNDALCVLPFNACNEKIYLGMWLWLTVLGIGSIILLVYRICLLSSSFRTMILKQSTKYEEIGGFGLFRKELKVGDWLLLRNISKNLDLFQFTQIVKAIHENLSNNSSFSY